MYTLDARMVILLTDLPLRYCVVGETDKTDKMMNNRKRQHPAIHQPSIDSVLESQLQAASKRLRLAAFVGRFSATLDCQIRIYALPDTADALDYVKQVERKMDGQLIKDTKLLCFVDNGNGLKFRVDDLSVGWKDRLQAGTQVRGN